MNAQRRAQLGIITETLHRLIPGAVPANVTVEVVESPIPGGGRHEWIGTPEGLGEQILTALYASPLTQAHAAKQARDLGGEISALMAGDRALRTAPWYPSKAGDLIHLAYEGDGAQLPAVGETYLVEPCPNDSAWLQLRLLHHTGRETDFIGAFAPGILDDPLMEIWMEAGPHRLTIVRDGRVIHPRT